ncbi:DUF4124 domain-containing protein [Aeromonas veronii]|uniref:DUF4124 domain-containing protein n=1 Tax=Aeromonas veronii TaxID=654 RepID=UPI0024448384|nr:DUF4124 domain-containing protein [Aeromonas veronii]
MNNKHGIGVLSLLLLTSFAADAAKVYSWVDGNGITHYSDAPPPWKKRQRGRSAGRPAAGQQRAQIGAGG